MRVDHADFRGQLARAAGAERRGGTGDGQARLPDGRGDWCLPLGVARVAAVQAYPQYRQGEVRARHPDEVRRYGIPYGEIVLRPRLMTSHGEQWQDCRTNMATCCYRGIILPSALTRYCLVAPQGRPSPRAMSDEQRSVVNDDHGCYRRLYPMVLRLIGEDFGHASDRVHRGDAQGGRPRIGLSGVLTRTGTRSKDDAKASRLSSVNCSTDDAQRHHRHATIFNQVTLPLIIGNDLSCPIWPASTPSVHFEQERREVNDQNSNDPN